MTTDNHKVQLEIEANAGDARGEIASVGTEADKMAQKVQQAGQRAGQGLDKVGQSGEQAAEKLSRAERSIVNAIQRSTAEMRTLGQGSAAKFDELARQRGLDASKIGPYIAALRQAEQEAEALARANARTGLSAKEMAFALRGVPAQFTDIFTSLASGQRPLTVLLQQGGQLKDMFGGIGGAAKALGGYIVGLINPFTLTIAAVAGLGYAFYAGRKEFEEYQKALILTGNAAGTTAGQLAGMAEKVAASSGATKGLAAEALAGLANTGKVAAGNLSLVAEAAIKMQRAAGVPLAETIKQFEELGQEPVKASEKLNEKTNYLTESIYRQIKALEDQGRVSEAAALAQKAYADAMNERMPQLIENLGWVEKLWRGITSETKRAGDAIAGIGRPTTTDARIKELETAQGRGFFNAHRSEAEDQELAALKQIKAEQDRIAAAKAKANEQEKAGIALLQEREKFLSKEEQKQRELLKLSAQYEQSAQSEKNRADYLAAVAGVMDKYAEKTKAAKKETDELGKLLDKINAKEAGLDASFWQDLGTLNVAYKAGKLDIDAYRVAVEKLVAQQKFHQDALKVEAQWQKELSESRAKDAAEATKEAEALRKKAGEAEYENRIIGMTKAQLADATMARYDEQIAIKESQADLLRGNEARQGELYAIELQIEALQRLKAAAGDKSVRQANQKAIEDQAKAWENFSRDIEQSLTDALMRGFESGEGFGENFVKTLQNTLKTAALKIAVQMVVQPVMGSLGQSLGYTQGGAGGGGLGGMSNIFSPISNIATSSIGGSAFGAGMLSGVSESLLGASFVGPSASLAGNASIAAGASFGSFLPAIGIGLGLLSLFGGDLFGGKEKPPVAAWTQFPQGSKDWGIPLATPWGDLRFAGQHMGDTEAEVAKLRDAFAPIAQRDYAISGLLTGEENKRIEQSIAGYTTGEMEDYSEAAMRAHFEKRLDLVSDAIGGWVDEIADAFVGDLEGSYTAIATLLSVRGVEGAEELARAFIGTLESAAGEAIVQAQSGTFMDAYINNLNAGGTGGGLVSSLSREGETAADTFARLVNDLVGVREAFDLMGRAALDFSLAAADMASSIIEAAGGAEAFKGKFSAYYAEFYTEQERLAKHTERTAAEFDKLGLAMPDSHAAFRDLVDGIDLTSAAGQELFASLLDLAPAFDIVADASAAAAEQAIQSAQAAAAQLAQLAQGRRALEIELQDALGNGAIAEAMRREDTLAGLDPSLRGLQQQIWSALDAAAAQARAAQDMAAKRELEIQLMEAQGNDAGATAARRALELEGTDEALRSLKQQIWAAQDARVAAEEAARMQAEAARMQAEAAEAARRAAEEQARAQQALRDGWQRVADSIWDTMRRLRGDILGPEQTFARAQSEFAIATAQARAGDQDAAGRLPTLAQAVVELGKSQASTAVEQALLTARTLASLDRTVKGLAQTFGLDVPAYAAGSSFIPRDTLALVHEGERIIPAADNRALIAAMSGDSGMASELRALRAEVALLRQANSAENSAIANHAKTAADVLDTSARGGRSLYTRTTA